MKNLLSLLTICLLFTLTSCTSTFAGSLFLITPKDVVYYVLAAIVFGFVMFAMTVKEAGVKILWMSVNDKWLFVFCVCLNVLLTPLFGIIYCISKSLSGSKK